MATQRTDAEILASNAEFWRQNPNFDVKCMDYIDYPKPEKKRNSAEWARRLSLRYETEEGHDEDYLRRKAEREERWKQHSVRIVAVSPWEKMGLSQNGQVEIERKNVDSMIHSRVEKDEKESGEDIQSHSDATKVEEDWIIISGSPKEGEGLKS